jgi:hypothetical protein
MEKVNEFCKRTNKCFGEPYRGDFGQCYKLKENINFNQFAESMPTLTFQFGNDINFDWKPHNYLVNITNVYDKTLNLCTGFLGWRHILITKLFRNITR